MGWMRAIANLVTAGGPGARTTFVSMPQSGPGEIEAKTNAAVFAAVRSIAGPLAQLRFRSPDPSTDELLRRPNAWQTARAFRYAIVQDMLLHGSAYVGKLPEAGANTVALAAYAARNMQVRPGPLGPEYRPSGHRSWIPASRMLHFTDGGDTELDKKVSRARAAQDPIRTLQAANAYIAQVFQRGVRANYVYTSARALNAEARAELTDRLTAAFGPEGNNAGGVAVVTGGDTLSRLEGLKPQDSNIRELRQDAITELAAVIGSAPFLAGAAGDTKYSNVTARLVSMFKGTFEPLIEELVEVFAIGLGKTVETDPFDLLKGDLPSLFSLGIQAAGGPILTVNEARELIQREAMEGWDKIRSSGPSAPLRSERSREGEAPRDDGASDPEGDAARLGGKPTT